MEGFIYLGLVLVMAGWAIYKLANYLGKAEIEYGNEQAKNEILKKQNKIQPDYSKSADDILDELSDDNSR